MCPSSCPSSVQFDAFPSKIDKTHFFSAEMNSLWCNQWPRTNPTAKLQSECETALSGGIKPSECTHWDFSGDTLQDATTHEPLTGAGIPHLVSSNWIRIQHKSAATQNNKVEQLRRSNQEKKPQKYKDITHFLSVFQWTKQLFTEKAATHWPWLQYCPLLAAVQMVTTVWEVWPD